MLYMKIVKRVYPKSSHHKENFSFISLILYLYEMTDVLWTYCDNHFIMYVSHHVVHLTLIQGCMSIISQWDWKKNNLLKAEKRKKNQQADNW